MGWPLDADFDRPWDGDFCRRHGLFALDVDLTSERERPPVLSVVWGKRLLGVLLGSSFVARMFGAACEEGASREALNAELEQLIVVSPLLLFGLAVFSVLGIEHGVVDRYSMAQSVGQILRMICRRLCRCSNCLAACGPVLSSDDSWAFCAYSPSACFSVMLCMSRMVLQFLV